ncbi:MAG TPA: hypothetical protein VGB46_06185 [Flavisolibacter sp.]|jgi:hypothetical protein
MRKTSIVLLLFLLVTSAGAQDIEVKDLFIPTSPGLVLADKAPSSVEKPTIPKAFGVSLLNLWQGGALEATPFWFTDKPDLEYEDWIKKKFLLIETFNISAATFKTDTSSILSAGLRTQLLRIYSKSHIRKLLAQEQKIIGLLTPGIGMDIDTAAMRKAYMELQELQKKGFFTFELAAAVLGSSGNNSFRNLEATKSGVWANLRWSPSNSMLDFVGVARYSWAVNEMKLTPRDSSFFDYGLSLHYEKGPLNISAEYVKRRDISQKQNADRTTFIATYQLTPNMAIVGSFGKNFAQVDNIIAIFGLNIGLSKGTVSNSK